MRISKLFFVLIFILNVTNILSAQQDCSEAIVVCGNSDINLDVNGYGIREFPNSCSSNENNSVWLEVTVVSGGTLGFTLTPNSNSITEDYDFFVFGPNATCDNLGSTIRCSTTNPQASGSNNNLTGMSATANDEFEGPGANGDNFVSWLNTNAGDTYFIVIDRPIGNSPFSLQWTGSAQFSDPPANAAITAGTPLDLDSCDITAPFNDGFTTFNLDSNTSNIMGSQTDVTVTYHESASDANIGINPLTSPYTNTSNTQTIYVRIENNTTGCFEVSDFQLEVTLGPTIATPEDYILCDDLSDGNDKNGLTTFDLSSKNNDILNGLSASNYTISYYTSQTHAENKTSPIATNYYNSTAFNETVYVRVEDNTYPDCNSIVPLNLQVNATPEAYNIQLLQCDEDGVSDGITQFNLTEAHDDITGGALNTSTLFYSDSSKTNLINGSHFTNTSNPQIIYVDVIDDNTGCSNTAELTIAVSVTQANNVSIPAICSTDGTYDGIETFNLQNADSYVLDGLPNGLSLNYYANYTDALLEQNALQNSYRNTTPYSQVIYARTENNNDCYGISEVVLNVNRLPDIKTEDLFYYCTNTFPETIRIDAALLSGTTSDYTYAWSTGASSYAIDINQVGNYSVTISNANGCSIMRTVTIAPSNTATINTIEVVDASENNKITILTSGDGIYEYALLDSEHTIIYPYQEDPVFENISPGIYNVSVTDTKNNCGTVEALVSVIGFPKFFTPNNDGVNDTWQVYGISDVFQPNSKILIFNRYGKLLKEISPTGSGWNGTYKGEVLPADDYWFAVTLQDGRVYKNHFSLKQ